jgi:HD-like signal output (HDOD) protein
MASAAGAVPDDIRARLARVAPAEPQGVEAMLVEQLRTGRAALPVLPQVASAALRLASDPKARIEELAGLVDTDPPIAARFLSVANSVSYWRGYLAASTQAAIVRLGLANTRDLLFQVVYASSSNGLKRFQNSVQTSFRRSVIAAVGARVAAQHLGIRTEYDYLAVLLHDIGEARIFRILDEVPRQQRLETRLVNQLVERFHCAAGADVAMAWRLPSEIVDACAAHHDESGTNVPHVKLVMVADAIVEAMKTAPISRPVDEVADTDTFNDLGIDDEMALLLVQRTVDGVGSMRP